jgi:hypothetical protein
MRFGPLLAAALFLAVAPGLSGQTSRFNVPFDFVGFDSDFPAGAYHMVLKTGESFARLHNTETGEGRVLVSSVDRPCTGDCREALVFERYGNVYVLRSHQLSAQGVIYTLPLSKQRRTLVQSYISQGVKAEQVLIAASW